MARLDTGWHAHPKVRKVGLAGMGLHAWSISYCDDVRSDGFIPTGTWPALPGIQKVITLLVEAGLWEPAAGGYQLHDYKDWNRSKAQIEADQETWKERQSRHRSRVTNAVTNADVTPHVTRDNGRDARARGQPNPGDVNSRSPARLAGRTACAREAPLSDLYKNLPREMQEHLSRPSIAERLQLDRLPSGQPSQPSQP